MNATPFHLSFITGTAVYLAIRGVYQRRSRAQAPQVSQSGRLDRLMLLLVGTSQVGLPVMLVLTPWLDWARWTHEEHSGAAGCLGLGLMATALWLFWRSHADLGENWSVSLVIQNDHQLVTRGVYRWVRHPMYAAFALLALSQALLLSNWLAGGAAVVAIAALCMRRIGPEEAMMCQRFGAAYRAYMQRTGCLWPRWHGRSVI
jgi:protein-S-isoprenylcysteine O-methyltransferase Ste14